MKNSKKCAELIKEIGELKNKIVERQGPFDGDTKLIFRVRDDKVADENDENLRKLQDEYNLYCKSN